ncbi:MarR family transcriptional regulator [Amycolatopsis endophytica]|uniref:DNA-binding MarR family transcriptional regulator n=1 Tax=Amycolatopsis endophytica TaxID=860233 RepID=A0A853BER0_9PSEU|nr:MarR family transcriptional regulator [Amycolatopsis endophytica]NYI93162.1 DNA-binding MarR family transcriptional regulator [Amycolatopsis endophytica]
MTDKDDVAEALDEMAGLVVRHLSERGGLSATALSCLSRLDRDGTVRLTALAAAEGVSQPSVSQLAQRLERQDLLRRVADPTDGRASLVEITGAGRALLAERRRIRHDRLAGLLDTLPPEDEDTLREALRRALPVVRRLAEAGTERGFR